MVLAWPVGKPRPFARGFWLAFVTVGAYGFYWDHKAHMELYHQFELKREWRGDGTPWYILSFLFWVLRFVYYHRFVANLQALMVRMGHPRPLTPAGILALKIPATTGLFLLLSIGVVLLLMGSPEATGGPWSPGLVMTGLALVAAGGVVWAVLKAVAYYRLQTAVNWIWGMYHHRMHQLSAAGGEPPAGVPPGGLAPATTEAPRSTHTPPL